MAKNITLMGANYPDVPAVELPQTGGGTASFTDVSDTTATAGDVASGKVFYTAGGVRTVGTFELRVEKKTCNAVTVAAGGVAYPSVSAALTGYTPIGIVGYDCGSGDLVPSSCFLTDNGVAAFTVKNTGTSQKSAEVSVYILYKKN